MNKKLLDNNQQTLKGFKKPKTSREMFTTQQHTERRKKEKEKESQKTDKAQEKLAMQVTRCILSIITSSFFLCLYVSCFSFFTQYRDFCLGIIIHNTLFTLILKVWRSEN